MPFYRTQLTTISPALHIKSSRLAPSDPLSFYQSSSCVFLQAAESSVFSKVRVCAAQRSNESPSGAFKRQNGLALARWRGLAPTSSRLRSNKHPSGVFERQNGLAQQDGGASPRQVRVCGAQRSNESPSGAFKRQNGLRQQMVLRGEMEHHLSLGCAHGRQEDLIPYHSINRPPPCMICYRSVAGSVIFRSLPT